MRLIDPGLGDVIDRLTILALKMLFGREGGKDVAHFEREQTALLAKVRSRELNGPWFHLALEISAVNAALWHAEDELRAMREQLRQTQQVAGSSYGALLLDAGETGVRIQVLNDRRAELVAAINKEAGDERGIEKVTS